MTTPGERRPARAASRPPSRTGVAAPRPPSTARAVLLALAVGLAGAVAWALLKGILEFPGVLAVAVVAGWGMGALLWQAGVQPLLAATIAAGAWLVGLVLTWLLAMALLPDSTRTLPERLEATPFLEWQAPQFGAIEIAGLVLYVLAALYGARSRPG